MGVLLFIVGVVIYLFVGSIIYGLGSDNDPDVESRAICVIAWPIVLVVYVVFWMVAVLDSYTDKIAGIAASSKKRIMERFRGEE